MLPPMPMPPGKFGNPGIPGGVVVPPPLLLHACHMPLLPYHPVIVLDDLQLGLPLELHECHLPAMSYHPLLELFIHMLPGVDVLVCDVLDDVRALIARLDV